MLAYNKNTLRNLAIHEQAEEAAHHKIISAENVKAIKLAYPVDLYTPNLFVRIGLAILTLFIVIAAVGLLALLTGFEGAGVMLTFCGLVCYGFLELMVVGKKHYNSGVDLILMISVILLLTTAVMDFLPYTVNDEVVASLCVFIISFYFAIRFADGLMAITASSALLLFLFYSIATMGIQARLMLPFIMIGASGVLYFAVKKISALKSAFYYDFAVKGIIVVALIALYVSGNYFVVREVSIDMFRFNLDKVRDIPMAWFFWLWTLAVPVVYIIVGLKKKDLVFTRLGILLSVFSVLTFRYYHAILPAETAMVLAGTLIIIITYSLVKYLRQPRYGFTFDDKNKKSADTLNLEGLIIGEAFGNKTAPQQQQGTTFGGGSFGGAGAGDTY